MTSHPIPHNYTNHILVASPSNVVRQRVLEGLRSPVRRFEQASGGAEALVHLESGFWQVLCLDRRLPDLNAEELSDTVHRRFPDIEVVLLDPERDAATGDEADGQPEGLALSEGWGQRNEEEWKNSNHASLIFDTPLFNAASEAKCIDAPLIGGPSPAMGALS